MSYDADAQAYFTKVEAVSDFDLTALDTWATADYVKAHINAYVIGMKADGNWAAMNDHCLLIGPRTVAGAAKKLAGASDWAVANGSIGYAPRNGVENLTGDTSIDTQHTAVSTQNNCSMWAWLHGTYINNNGRYLQNTGASHILGGASGFARMRANSSTLNSVGTSSFTNDMFGWSRSLSTEYDFITGPTAGTFTQSPNNAPSGSNFLFAANADGVTGIASGQSLSAYGFGTACNLLQVQTRFAALKTALNVFTPIGVTTQTRRRRSLGGFGL